MAIVRTALAWAAPAAEGLRASVACASWVRALCNAAATVPTRTTTLLGELSPLIGPVASARYCRFSLAEWRGRPPPAGASSSGDDDSQASLGPRVRRPVRCPVTERSAGYANRAAFVFENPRHYLDRMALVAEWNFLAYVTSLCYWVNASQKNARLWSTIRLPVLDDGNTCCASTGTRPCRFSQHPHTYAIGGDASRAVPRGDAHFATRNGLPDRLLGYVLEQALVGFDETERGTPWVLDLYSGTNSARRAVQVGAAPAGVRVVSVNACDIVDGPATHRPDLYVDIVADRGRGAARPRRRVGAHRRRRPGVLASYRFTWNVLLALARASLGEPALRDLLTLEPDQRALRRVVPPRLATRAGGYQNSLVAAAVRARRLPGTFARRCASGTAAPDPARSCTYCVNQCAGVPFCGMR